MPIPKHDAIQYSLFLIELCIPLMDSSPDGSKSKWVFLNPSLVAHSSSFVAFPSPLLLSLDEKIKKTLTVYYTSRYFKGVYPRRLPGLSPSHSTKKSVLRQEEPSGYICI